MRLGKVRLQGDCPVVACKRFSEALQSLQTHSQVIVSVGTVRAELDRFAQQINGSRRPIGFERDDPENMQGRELSGMTPEDFRA